MSGSRKFIFLLLSIVIHMAVAITIGYLANSKEKIYENVEITAIDLPVRKNTEIKPAATPEKIQTSKQTTPAAIDADSNNSKPQATEAHDTIADELARESEITSPAVLLTKTKANRTEAARKADYSGISQVELVIGSDGLVKNVKLRNSLPYGLDEVALTLAKESKFKPAMIKNKPVASAILFKVRFESEK